MTTTFTATRPLLLAALALAVLLGFGLPKLLAANKKVAVTTTPAAALPPAVLVEAAVVRPTAGADQVQATPNAKPEIRSVPVASARALPPGLTIAGTVLASPYQAVRTPVGGRVVDIYVSEGQAVRSGAPLLKLLVGRGLATRTVFASAPAAGDLSHVTASSGYYLAAGTPYARLAPHSPVRVRVASADAARLHPGDSLQVVKGPVGLVGVVTPLTALLPGLAGDPVVLVLGRQGWPPGTTVQVVLAPRPSAAD
jgi:biotin carboxyl carrier protein